jgi:D-aminopeptidase
MLGFGALSGLAAAAEGPARTLGIPFVGTPGPLDAITDVPGVQVGEVTLIEDLPDGHKVRTGVTAILPRGHGSLDTPAFAGWYALNGNGEMTGTTWVQTSGTLEGPVMLTNTHSVGVVRDGEIKYRVQVAPPDSTGYWWSLPVVAETWDGYLNDINGLHVTEADATRALRVAKGGPVAEGNVGGGTGMICFEFKCGTGTASRVMDIGGHVYTVGVLVQANYGMRKDLLIAGVPVGEHLLADRVFGALDPVVRARDTASCIVVVATDAPLLPVQLQRLAARAGLGLARTGTSADNGDGDIFIAFSTANAAALHDRMLQQATFIGNDHLDPLFHATVRATEEAVDNAMIAAGDMCGEDGHCVKAIPHGKLIELLRRYGRYEVAH